jgi:hypothetical protein
MTNYILMLFPQTYLGQRQSEAHTKNSRVVSINQLVNFKRTQNHNTIFQAPFSREIMVLKYAITQGFML